MSHVDENENQDAKKFNYYQLLFIPATAVSMIALIMFIYVPLRFNLQKYFDQSASTTNFSFIGSIADLRETHRVLMRDDVWNNHGTELLLLYCLVYLFNQTFCVPGSVIMNVTAGAFFGLFKGTMLVAALTACGASCAYLLSKFSIANGEQAILFKYKFLRVRYEAFKNLVSKRLNPLHLFCYLIALRLFPASPNWMINILSPHLNIPLHVFSPSVFIGLLPFHYVTVSAGLVLATLTSPQEVISGQTIITMLLLAVLMCTIPPLLKKRTDMFNV